MKRLVAGFVVVAILFGACHSIDRNVFAHGPVPLSDLSFREPLLWSVGPDAGKPVPAQNGLLATYFSGAAYIQPSWNGRLDHQQIDPNVNFFWNASDTNPVVTGPGSIDTNEGDFRLPDHWRVADRLHLEHRRALSERREAEANEVGHRRVGSSPRMYAFCRRASPSSDRCQKDTAG